ncbi:unnamed protein product [Cercospora beticola]|nr:unnamed protein product [Cercospora beticola]
MVQRQRLSSSPTPDRGHIYSQSVPDIPHDDSKARRPPEAGTHNTSTDWPSTCTHPATIPHGINSISSQTRQNACHTSPANAPSIAIPTTNHSSSAVSRAASDPFGSAALLVHQSTIHTLTEALIWRRAVGIIDDKIIAELEDRLEKFSLSDRQIALFAAEQRFRAMSCLVGMEGSKERITEAVRLVRKLADMLETVGGGKYVELSEEMHGLVGRMGA